MGKSNFRKSDFTTVQNFQKGPFPAKMAMIGQKIGFGPGWPHLVPLGGQKGVLEMTFSRSDSKFMNNLLQALPGANLVKIASQEPIF